MSKVIVLDVDGTLFDTQEGILQAFNYVLKEQDKPLLRKQEISKYIGPSVKNVFMKFYEVAEKEADEMTKQYRKVYVEEFIGYSTIYDNWIEAINTLRKNEYKVCIATMKTQLQIDKLLEIFNIRDLFDLVIGAKEDGSLSKSRMLSVIKESMHGTSTQCYMVGDTIGDYIASDQNNYRFIYAKYGYGNVDEENCFMVLKKPKDILKICIDIGE